MLTYFELGLPPSSMHKTLLLLMKIYTQSFIETSNNLHYHKHTKIINTFKKLQGFSY